MPSILSLTTLLSVLLIFPSLGTSRAIERRAACPNVHIILARGNDEPYPGRQGALKDKICARFASGTCDYEDLQYDVKGEYYCNALNKGPPQLISQMNAFNKRCPNSHIVLSGYSQGAQVVGDVLGGGGGKFYDGCVQQTNAALNKNTAAAKKIVAALVFGDMRHTANQPYNVGDGSARSSDYPRPAAQLTGMKNFSSILRSWCDAVDPICAKGNDGKDHEKYFDHYAAAAADFVVQKINALKK